MNIEIVKDLANPYYPLTSRVSDKDFIGREDQLKKLRLVLDDYTRTARLKNILISGEKSVGKSTLVNNINLFSMTIISMFIPLNYQEILHII